MAKPTDIQVVDAAPVAVRSEVDQITKLLEAAVDKNIPVESLEKLVALHERMADRAAASEFAGAMSAFQRDCPSIKKESKAIVKKDGVVKYTYNYAELDAIAGTVNSMLAGLGLSYTWDGAEKEDGVSVTCTLRHVNGHSISSTFFCRIDTRAAMSVSQQSAAAVTYAKRQSLIQILGLTTTEPDTDGRVASSETITESQAADLRAKAVEVKVKHEKVFAAFGVESYEQIKASDFAQVVKRLENARRSQ